MGANDGSLLLQTWRFIMPFLHELWEFIVNDEFESRLFEHQTVTTRVFSFGHFKFPCMDRYGSVGLPVHGMFSRLPPGPLEDAVLWHNVPNEIVRQMKVKGKDVEVFPVRGRGEPGNGCVTLAVKGVVFNQKGLLYSELHYEKSTSPFKKMFTLASKEMVYEDILDIPRLSEQFKYMLISAAKTHPLLVNQPYPPAKSTSVICALCFDTLAIKLVSKVPAGTARFYDESFVSFTDSWLSDQTDTAVVSDWPWVEVDDPHHLLS